jgi:hypothetical protein
MIGSFLQFIRVKILETRTPVYGEMAEEHSWMSGARFRIGRKPSAAEPKLSRIFPTAGSKALRQERLSG